MSNYTLTHTSKTTLLSVKMSKNGFTDIAQYEFQQLLSESDIAKIYEDLSDVQKKTLNINKNTFKQFVRAISMRFPVETKAKSATAVVSALVREEKSLIASQMGKPLGITSNEATDSIVGYGTIDGKKYDRLIKDSKTGTLLEENNLIYWTNENFIMAVKTKPSYQTSSNTDMYIYVTLLVS